MNDTCIERPRVFFRHWLWDKRVKNKNCHVGVLAASCHLWHFSTHIEGIAQTRFYCIWEIEGIRSLQVRSLMKEYAAKGNPVAGVIVEPIQGEGGDNHASAEYFRQLQKICKEVS